MTMTCWLGRLLMIWAKVSLNMSPPHPNPPQQQSTGMLVTTRRKNVICYSSHRHSFMSAGRLIGLFRGSFSPELWNYGISDVRRGELRRTMFTESGRRLAPISPSGVSRSVRKLAWNFPREEVWARQAWRRPKGRPRRQPPHVFRKLTHFSYSVYDNEDLFTIINIFINPALDNERRLLVL